MKKILLKSLFIVFVINLVVGCTLTSNNLVELKPNLNNLTKRANTAIERRGIKLNDVNEFLITKYPILMENFKDYDLKVKYENKITIVLVCKDNKAIYEDLSCNLRIDKDYTKDDKECAFYIENPVCEN